MVCLQEIIFSLIENNSHNKNAEAVEVDLDKHNSSNAYGFDHQPRLEYEDELYEIEPPTYEDVV